MKCNFVSGGVVSCFKIAYDEAFARFSPGVQMELANVAAFHDRPELASMDSCADPDNQMINRLWPDRRPIATLLAPARGPGGLAARTQAQAAARLRRRLKEAA
jgi:CelD/BcsL family acetyltransferase involved in cellulose biosynthesis